MTRSLTIRTLLLALAAAAALPGVASASRVTVTRAVIGTAEVPAVFVDGFSGTAPGGSFSTTNRIFIEDDASCQQFPTSCNTFLIRDLGSSLLAVGPHCRQVSLNVASCSGAQIGDVRHYSLLLGDGNDQLTVTSRYLSQGGAIQGGAGDDAFTLPLRAPDQIIGGAGRDSLSYVSRSGGGGVRVDPFDSGFNDGQSNEDRVSTDIEQVTGTQFDDVIFVPNQGNESGAPHGLLSGAGGNDQLFGSPFADTLNGGAGVDVLSGGSGDDLLESRENAMAGDTVARDELRCGQGLDTAVMDLQDIQTDCEFLSRAAIDEGGTLAIVTRTAKIRAGRIVLRLRCPGSSKTPCNGRVAISRGDRTLGSARYALQQGESSRVTVGVGRRRGRATATAVELDSKGRPKTTVVQLTLR